MSLTWSSYRTASVFSVQRRRYSGAAGWRCRAASTFATMLDGSSGSAPSPSTDQPAKAAEANTAMAAPPIKNFFQRNIFLHLPKPSGCVIPARR